VTSAGGETDKPHCLAEVRKPLKAALFHFKPQKTPSITLLTKQILSSESIYIPNNTWTNQLYRFRYIHARKKPSFKTFFAYFTGKN